jgi:hypothetical protein
MCTTQTVCQPLGGKEGGARKKEEGRRRKEEGGRKKEEGRVLPFLAEARLD